MKDFKSASVSHQIELNGMLITAIQKLEVVIELALNITSKNEKI